MARLSKPALHKRLQRLTTASEKVRLLLDVMGREKGRDKLPREIRFHACNTLQSMAHPAANELIVSGGGHGRELAVEMYHKLNLHREGAENLFQKGAPEAAFNLLVRLRPHEVIDFFSEKHRFTRGKTPYAGYIIAARRLQRRMSKSSGKA